MRPSALFLVSLAAMSGVVALMAYETGHAGEAAAPIFVKKIPRATAIEG